MYKKYTFSVGILIFTHQHIDAHTHTHWVTHTDTLSHSHTAPNPTNPKFLNILGLPDHPDGDQK